MNATDNASPAWLEAQYLLWLEDPEKVPPDMRQFFAGFELGNQPDVQTDPIQLERMRKQSAVQTLIYRYRDIGHLLACTDPLSPCQLSHPLLELSQFGLSEDDLETVFSIPGFCRESGTLKEIVALLKETYCGSIGIEFMYIQDPRERQWLMERMEPNCNRPDFPFEERLGILGKLMESALFEEFLNRHFVGQKRFSLEGGDVLLPLLECILHHAANEGIRDLVLGMSHRGRLNVLANIFQKPYENIFNEFKDNVAFGFTGEGDVKYHRGYSADRRFPNGSSIHITLAANPSHLEAVDPVVEGKARARQERRGMDGERAVLPVLVHGDAAFAGQGLVAEVFNLSQLEGYRTGGTLHIVMNNQIGFTTPPEEGRSSRYATDVAKMVEAPVFHVHGDDPEAVLHIGRLALEFRQEFGRDVVMEVICYRRRGHNEGDEPFFTQPIMYRQISNRPSLHVIYGNQLQAEGVSGEDIEQLAEGIRHCLDESFDKEAKPLDLGFSGQWQGIGHDYKPMKNDTGVSGATLRQLAMTITTVPEGFQIHPKIESLLLRRRKQVESGEGIDWGSGEALAFATLLREGVPIRLSGQDTRRGTFNHRHAHLYDQVSGAVYVPLAQVSTGQRLFHAYDSMLSENAVLGFEYGYSLETPNGLIIWEAQFGDFANGGQVVIDQFVVAGESKWNRVSGLVMLLPHGYEGQGAEHSSARIERYLQLCAGDNIQVCQPSTPAQLFHLLRRQLKQPFRKPLIVFTPKSLLRHPRCVSRRDELESGWFREFLPPLVLPQGASRLLVCSGRIYFDLLEELEKRRRNDVAILRVEQFYPLRSDLLEKVCLPYMQAQMVAWVQDEPANMGAWSFMRPHLAALFGREPRYIGRPPLAAPATGSHKQHQEEQERIIREAFEE
jgi:2-oxoglutarate dehydrogenase E1 component